MYFLLFPCSQALSETIFDCIDAAGLLNETYGYVKYNLGLTSVEKRAQFNEMHVNPKYVSELLYRMD